MVNKQKFYICVETLFIKLHLRVVDNYVYYFTVELMLDTKMKIFKFNKIHKDIFISGGCIDLLMEHKDEIYQKYKSYNFLYEISNTEIRNILVRFEIINNNNNSIGYFSIIVFLDGFFIINTGNFISINDFSSLILNNDFILINDLALVRLFSFKINFFNLYNIESTNIISSLFNYNHKHVTYFMNCLRSLIFNYFEECNTQLYFSIINLPIDHHVHIYLYIFNNILKNNDISIDLLINDTVILFGIDDEFLQKNLYIWAREFPKILIYISYYHIKKINDNISIYKNVENKNELYVKILQNGFVISQNMYILLNIIPIYHNKISISKLKNILLSILIFIKRTQMSIVNIPNQLLLYSYNMRKLSKDELYAHFFHLVKGILFRWIVLSTVGIIIFVTSNYI
jgi:hypothetical protein